MRGPEGRSVDLPDDPFRQTETQATMVDANLRGRLEEFRPPVAIDVHAGVFDVTAMVFSFTTAPIVTEPPLFEYLHGLCP